MDGNGVCRTISIKGVAGVAGRVRSAITLATRQRTGQRWGSPERPCPIFSPRTPFIWRVKVSEAKVAALRSGIGAVDVLLVRVAIHKDKLRMQNKNLEQIIQVNLFMGMFCKISLATRPQRLLSGGSEGLGV